MRALMAGAAVLVLAGAAQAADEPRYGPAPAWATASPPTGAAAADAGGSVQILMMDSQNRFTGDTDGTYFRMVARIAAPAGLQELGSISHTWNPETTEVTFHHLRILRGDKVIDVLAADKFLVLRRENNLEQAMLDGTLTATIQLKGLQVGDLVDYSVSEARRDPVLAGRSQTQLGVPPAGVPGTLRYRVWWPKTEKVRWRATKEFGEPKVVETEAGTELVFEGRGLSSLRPIDGAPERFNPQRRLELTEFADWAEVSGLMAPLYAKAATLAPDSPLKAEAAKIRAASEDPEVRAEMALRLVQEQVRYVFIGMNSGAWTPASADETWTRRFGDCKGKTALLLALLAELGIKAEAVLVNTAQGEVLEERLPRLNLFDHVLVRADIGGGRTRWLDGTRTGDRDLEFLPPPPWRWGLPVRAAGAVLEPIEPTPAVLPYGEVRVLIDATAGLDQPHKLSGETFLRGDAAAAVQRGLSSMSKDDAERAVRKAWTDNMSWAEPERVGWAYDEATGVLRFWFEGTGEDDWQADGDKTVRAFEIDHGAFGGLGKFKRDKDQPKDTPYLAQFPYYERWTTVVRLPDGGEGFTLDGENVDETVGAYSFVRHSRVQDGVVVMSRALRSLKPEISAEEAEAVNARAKTFPSGGVWVQRPVAPAKPAKATTPTEPDEMVAAGWDLLGEQRHDRALALFDRALRADPDNVWAVKGRALAYELRGDMRRALREYEAALKRKPGVVDLQLARAEALGRAGQPDKQLQALNEALAAKPEELDLLTARAALHQECGRPAEALADADKAVGLAKDSYPLRLRAWLHLEQGRPEAALVDIDAALARAPDEADNWRYRGDIETELKRYDGAEADYARALAIEPLHSDAMDAMGRLALRRGRPERLTAGFDQGLALAPASATLLNGRCWIRVLADRELDKAAADCDAALKLEPKDGAVLDSRAWVSLRQGKWDDAVARFDAALAAAPGLPASLYGRGLARLRKGETEAGQRDLAAARAAFPGVDAEFAEFGLKP